MCGLPPRFGVLLLRLLVPYPEGDLVTAGGQVVRNCSWAYLPNNFPLTTGRFLPAGSRRMAGTPLEFLHLLSNSRSGNSRHPGNYPPTAFR